MSRSHRQPTLLAVTLLALSVAMTACGTEGTLGTTEASTDVGPGAGQIVYSGPKDTLSDAAATAPSSISAAILAAPRASLTAVGDLPLGTALLLADDACMPNLPIGFPFDFYGQVYSTLGISSNGTVAFGACHNGNDGVLPKGNLPLAAPAIGDWLPEGGVHDVFYTTIGTTPNRRFVVTWNDIAPWGQTTRPHSTFRLILHETSNLVEFDYPSVPHIRNSKYRAGISASTSKFIVIATGAELLQLSGTSVCFTPAGSTGYSVSHEACPLPVVPNRAPTADAGGPYAAEEGSPISFDGALSSDPDGDVLSFAWTFGDGAGGSGTEVSHVYADQGAYPVSLVVADPDGLTSTAAVTANVFNVAPSVTLAPAPWLSTGAPSIASASSVVSGETVTLSASFADPGVVDAPWTWTVAWGDGGTYTGTSNDQATPVVVERRLLKAGSYTLTVTLEDKDHDVGTATGSFVVTRFPIDIDIKPGSQDNTISSASNGRIWVAVLGSPSLDVSRIDVPTVTFGGAAPYVRRGSAPYRIEDVDSDGDADMLMQFETQAIARAGGLSPWTTSIELRATLLDGREGSGSGTVHVVR